MKGDLKNSYNVKDIIDVYKNGRNAKRKLPERLVNEFIDILFAIKAYKLPVDYLDYIVKLVIETHLKDNKLFFGFVDDGRIINNHDLTGL